MEVNYIAHMGSDDLVVDAARVSFAKQAANYSPEANAKLIRFLARNGHWTPFGHPQITLHFKAPIFVARQLAKHQAGFVWNEVSRRYVDTAPEFYVPSEWRMRADNLKQGSSEAVSPASQLLKIQTKEICQQLKELYLSMVNDLKIAPEQARMVLPQNMYTEWYWTGSLAAWVRVHNLRAEKTAQLEVQEIATQINYIIKDLFPISWEALTENTE